MKIKIIVKIVLINIVLVTNLNALTGEELQKKGIDGIEQFIEIFQQTGKYDKEISNKVLNQLNQSINMFKKEKNLVKLSFSQIKIGDLYRMNNQFDLAYSYYQSALKLSSQISHKENESRARLGKAQVEVLHLKKYSDAKINIEKAFSLIKDSDLNNLKATVLLWKSNLEIDQNDYPSAFITVKKAFKIAKKVNDNTLLFSLYTSIAEVSYKRGLICNYTTFFNECENRFILALNNYDKALVLAKKAKWKNHIFLIENLLSEIDGQLVLLRKREESQKKLDNLGNTTTMFSPKSEEDVLVHERFILTPLEDVYSFLMKIKLKKDIKLLHLFESKKSVNTLSFEGIDHEANGEILKALKSYVATINLLEKQRDDVEINKRKDYLVDKMEYYYRPLKLFLQMKKREEAFNIMERSRESILLDLLTNKKEKSLDDINNSSEAMKLRSKILDLKWKNFEKYSSAKVKKITTLEQEYKRMTLSFNKDINPLPQVPILVPTLKDIQKELQEKEYEIIEYVVQKTQLIVWHIRKDKIDVKSVYLPQSELVKKVDSLNNTLKIANPKSYDFFDYVSSQDLFLYLIQPILKNIKSKHLVIIPHYELNQLPFQVLLNPENNESLGEKFQISYAPSASILMELNSIKNLKDRKVLAIGEPTMTKGLEEIDYITSLYPQNNTKIVKDKVTKKEFYKSIKGHNIIHLSLHGEYLSQTPMLSNIKLPPYKSKQGYVTASEMFSLPLEKNSLVVLSACETGKVKFTQSNETLGIVRALIYAGADALVLSSWKVNEEATALWMKTFYEVAQKENLVEASRQAIIKVKNTKKYSHPHYWAGFSLVGK